MSNGLRLLRSRGAQSVMFGVAACCALAALWLAAASRHEAQARVREQQVQLESLARMQPPAVTAPVSSALAAIALPLLLALAGFALAALVLWRGHARPVAASRDAVTGLPNRRQLVLDLPGWLSGASAAEPVALILLELNGFKAYNDRFGHQAGDRLLQLLARRVEATVGERGVVYRLGGGEFCVVATVDPARGEDELVVLAIASLSEQGDGFDIKAGCGVVLLPEEANEVAVALRVADQRLYANKQGGRRSAGRQSTDVLLRALSERSPELGSHLHDVAELAGQVAARMGMADEEIDHLLQAAELHDVGKMAIPDAILKKPGPLDQEEWRFIRGHTVIGERIVSAAPALAPVARLIRSSHERWDGTGYPDRLLEDQIPLGSRIIAVCDAFDAMIGSRPHRLGMTDDEALSELRRCAGSQFDPDVVRAFAAAFEALAGDGRAAA
jgi:diguanylate cyclase (GGDEF)-like protein